MRRTNFIRPSLRHRFAAESSTSWSRPGLSAAACRSFAARRSASGSRQRGECIPASGRHRDARATELEVPDEAPFITIFVRQSQDCKDVGNEFCKRCKCKKHLRWSMHGKHNRKKTGSRSWAGCGRCQARTRSAAHRQGPASRAVSPKRRVSPRNTLWVVVVVYPNEGKCT